MAVGESHIPTMPVIAGVSLSAVEAGIKKRKGLDLVLIALPDTATVAGVFTQNAFCAAPVTLCRQHLQQTKNSRYLLINSGNANACTGAPGMSHARQSCVAVAESAGVTEQEVLPFSTGVIGEPLPVEKIIKAVSALLSGLREDNWQQAARGIMTTDTRPKLATITRVINGKSVTINGIAKGAGMIKPNMATMLAYVATDAGVDETLLQELTQQAADRSFNRITIDGDTSTNDSCMVVAAGTGQLHFSDKTDLGYPEFNEALTEVLQILSQAIVRDGEGATKFVSVVVEEGKSADECLQVAYAIAHSPLVKTALFACDPNWGRIVAAIGYAGIEALDVSLISIYLGDVLIVENGGRSHSYREEEGQAVMNQSEITLRVRLGRGEHAETVWTTDLSHDYVKINAEYRT